MVGGPSRSAEALPIPDHRELEARQREEMLWLWASQLRADNESLRRQLSLREAPSTSAAEGASMLLELGGGSASSMAAPVYPTSTGMSPPIPASPPFPTLMMPPPPPAFAPQQPFAGINPPPFMIGSTVGHDSTDVEDDLAARQTAHAHPARSVS